MKRLAMRLSALAVVAALGIVGVVRMQNDDSQGESPEITDDSSHADESSPANGTQSGTVATETSAPSDPFQAERLNSRLSGGFSAPPQGAAEPRRLPQYGSATATAVVDEVDASVAQASDESDQDVSTVDPGKPKADPFAVRQAANGSDDSAADNTAQEAPATVGPNFDTESPTLPNKPRDDAKPLADAGESAAASDLDSANDGGTLPESRSDAPSGRELYGSGALAKDATNAPAARSLDANPLVAGDRSVDEPPANDAASLPITPTTLPAAGSEGTGRPGPKELEGAQAPVLTVEKTAPSEIQVGKPAKFEIRVRNTGNVAAQNVEVHDEVPKGTQLISTTPPAGQGPRGEIVWNFGAVQPGDEVTATVELMPTEEGEIGSVATVHFAAGASARTVATKPELTLEVTAAKQVMIGDDVTFSIKISNPGTGAATGVMIEEHVPEGLKHTAGPELEYEVGQLLPGESRDLELTLTAEKAGPIINTISARGEASLHVEQRVELEVVAPGLDVALDGPTRRYLERQATYTVQVRNPGTAPAKDVELVTYLPKGLKFVEANNSGTYDEATHSVAWSLAELPPAETGNVTLTALPIEPGEQKLRAAGRAKQGLADEAEQAVMVEGLAAIMFEVVDVADPIEVGGETSYEVRVTNQGSKAATNVQVSAILPPDMRAIGAEGPTRHVVQGERIVFDPLTRLAPKADTTYRIRTQGVSPGDQRIKVQLVTDEIREPVTKEESTRVYADE